jgi:hypothetical protein
MEATSERCILINISGGVFLTRPTGMIAPGKTFYPKEKSWYNSSLTNSFFSIILAFRLAITVAFRAFSSGLDSLQTTGGIDFLDWLAWRYPI